MWGGRRNVRSFEGCGGGGGGSNFELFYPMRLDIISGRGGGGGGGGERDVEF